MLFTAAANQVPARSKTNITINAKHSGVQQPGRMHRRLYECVRAEYTEAWEKVIGIWSNKSNMERFAFWLYNIQDWIREREYYEVIFLDLFY